MIRPNYQHDWTDEEDVVSEDEKFEEEELTYTIDTPSQTTCMINDIKLGHKWGSISIHMSLMDEYGQKVFKAIIGDIFFDVFVEAFNERENICSMLGYIRCYNNTPEYVTNKYTAMGYSDSPIHVWRLNIRENKLDDIYRYCMLSKRRMFVNTDLNDALPMVQKNLGIYVSIPADSPTIIPYNSLTKPNNKPHFICRKLSVDIEVITPPEWKLFPDASVRGCEIIIIACTRQLDDGAYETDILYTDAKRRKITIEGERRLHRFDTESEMLEYFINSVNPHNTDVITGWNIRNFDLKYIYDRCKHFYPNLVNQFTSWTLNDSQISFYSVFNKGQNVTMVNCFGIMILDMYDYNKTNVKAKSYKLKDIAKQYLDDDKQKLSIDYKDISRFYVDGNEKEFTHLLQYCSVDAEIVLDLMAVQKVWNNTVSMADICHVPMNYVMNCGVMLRNTCMISQFVNEHTDYILPYKHYIPYVDYEGGYVNEPVVGFHTDPIFVLDFNSLYPTTMLAFNICTTSIVCMDDVPNYPEDYNPEELNDVVFTKGNLTISATPYMKNVGFVANRRGVMPQILHNLLTTRKSIQNQLKQTTDAQQRKQLDAQQLSYKLCANAIYGLLGCSFSPLYNPKVAASVTSFGRFLSYIKRKRITEYLAADNIEGRIVYGDTDSVMVQVKTSIPEAKAIAERYADMVTRDIGIPPIRTEYEKIFCPFLIHKKKHYIGVMYTDNTEKYLRVEYKGNEMVRTDNCSLTTDVMREIINILCLYNGTMQEKKIKMSECLHELLADWAALYEMYRSKGKDPDLVKRVVNRAIYSKKLAKTEYVNRLPHVAVYERMKNRKQYHVGDRIVYCIANTEFTDKIKPKNIIEMAYDIDEFLEDENLYLAIHYYLDACIRKPLYRLFVSLDSEFKKMLEDTITELFPPLPTTAVKRKGKNDVTNAKKLK